MKKQGDWDSYMNQQLGAIVNAAKDKQVKGYNVSSDQARRAIGLALSEKPKKRPADMEDKQEQPPTKKPKVQ